MVHERMKILSPFTHPHVVPNPDQYNKIEWGFYVNLTFFFWRWLYGYWNM